MDEPDQNDDDWQQHVNDVMEQFERDTELIFRKFYQKCEQSGYRINRVKFMKLVTERMSKAFNEFRCEMEENKQLHEEQNLHDKFEKDLSEFAAASKPPSKKTVKISGAHLERRQRFLNLLEQYTSNMFNGKEIQSKSRPNRNATDSLVVSMGMSSSAPSPSRVSKAKRRQMAASAKNPCCNAATVTVTRMVEQSNGVHRKMIITKRKSTTISMTGVTIEHGSTDSIEEGSKMETAIDDESSTVSEFIKYRCVHCHDENQWIETFNAVKDVYTHWWVTHTDTQLKPFRYFVVEYVACYHCSAIGTHYELVKHHKTSSHATMPFAIVRQQSSAQQCALCPYSGTGVVAHFQTMHKFVLKTLSVRQLRSIHIPFRLTNTQLDAYLFQKLHKKQKCGNCNEIFEIERELRDHHGMCHKAQKMTIKEFYDNNNMHLVCNCCHMKIDRSLYLSHIEKRPFDFRCHKCVFSARDMIKLVKHDAKAHGHRNSFECRCMQYKNRLKRDYLKTQVIFGNGLVLTKQNLLGTKYDDSQQFEVFVDKLLEIKKERHDRKC